jgi:hypothetical protein
MARQADGSYAADASWTAKRYQMWPGSWYTPSGYFIATDAAGNVYVADGTWGANQTNAVIKYDSAGTYVTHFGDYTKGWERGMFHWALGGLAVSASGSTIYTSEIGNNRVQRWTHTGDGVGYRVASDADLFGSSAANNADRAGYCDYAGWRGTLAAPYDVALDGADNLYVINTTCKQVLSFAPNFGPMRANLDVRVAGGDYPRPHGFTVGRNGAVYVGENQRVLRPAGGAQPGNGGAPAASSGASSPVVEPAPSGGTPSGSSPTDILRDSTDISRPAIDPRPQTNLRPQITPRPQRPVQQAALADARPPRVQLGRLQVLRRAMRVPVGCSETCRVEVTARQGSLMAGRRVMWLRAGRTLPVAARITMRARAGRVMLQVRVRDRAGNTVAYRRAGTIAGAGTITRSRRR